MTNESFPKKEIMVGLDLPGLQVFCEIVESGSFTAAAARLGMGPPMVSKHVARLERQLGARLLNRTSRRMSLTEAGTLFHERARQAIDLLSVGATLVGQTTGVPRGELKVSAPVWCATARFARLIADYRARYPQVCLDLHLENRVVDLVGEGFDVALRMTVEPLQSLIARPLCAVAFHCVATPDYLRARQPHDDGEKLPPIELILPNYLQFDRLKFPTPEMRAVHTLPVAMRSSDTTLSYHACLAGMGAAFLPGWLVDDDLASGRLVQVFPTRDKPVGKMFAVYASRQHLAPKLRSFIDFLVDRLNMNAVRAP